MACRPSRRRVLQSTVAAGATLGAPWIVRAAPKHKLRIATLAPVGSTWHKTFTKIARQVRTETDGAIEIKIYAGGTMGDEGAMIRKMRMGQLDGAAVTNVGLGFINKQVLMLQLPLLFKTYEDLDRVRDAMSDKFEALIEKEGFVLDGNWGDVGFAYLFSQTPVRRPSDVKKTKMWVWGSDPMTKQIVAKTGVNPVHLDLPDVLAALQTGLVDAYLNSPYGAIALQWYTKSSYVTDLKLAMMVGGSVLNASSWDALSAEHQDTLRRIVAPANLELRKKVRQANKKAKLALIDRGITAVQAEDFDQWERIGKDVRDALTGSVFDEALVAEMLGHLGR